MNKRTLITNCIFSLFIFLILVWKKAYAFSDFRLYGIVAIVYAYVYYSEMTAHKRRMSDWANIRLKGKTRFILFDYVLLRGGSVSILIILILSLKISITVLLVCSVIPLLGVSAFAGNEVWKQCEQSYALTKLKSIAENMKILQN